MKASELARRLQDLIATFGDLEVCTPSPEETADAGELVTTERAEIARFIGHQLPEGQKVICIL